MDRARAAVSRKIEDGLNREGDVRTRIREEPRPLTVFPIRPKHG